MFVALSCQCSSTTCVMALANSLAANLLCAVLYQLWLVRHRLTAIPLLLRSPRMPSRIHSLLQPHRIYPVRSPSSAPTLDPNSSPQTHLPSMLPSYRLPLLQLLSTPHPLPHLLLRRPCFRRLRFSPRRRPSKRHRLALGRVRWHLSNRRDRRLAGACGEDKGGGGGEGGTRGGRSDLGRVFSLWRCVSCERSSRRRELMLVLTGLGVLIIGKLGGTLLDRWVGAPFLMIAGVNALTASFAMTVYVQHRRKAE